MTEGEDVGDDREDIRTDWRQPTDHAREDRIIAEARRKTFSIDEILDKVERGEDVVFWQHFGASSGVTEEHLAMLRLFSEHNDSDEFTVFFNTPDDSSE